MKRQLQIQANSQSSDIQSEIKVSVLNTNDNCKDSEEYRARKIIQKPIQQFEGDQRKNNGGMQDKQDSAMSENEINNLIQQQIKRKSEKRVSDFNNHEKNKEKAKNESLSLQSLIISETQTMDLKKPENIRYPNFEQYQLKFGANFMSDQIQAQFRNKKLKPRILQTLHLDKQKKYLIRQIPVYFPYQCYQIQQDYMKAVIDALNQGQNAILQSPTGTGKTLCLLSAVLSWVDNYRETKQAEKMSVIYCSRTHSQLRHVQSELQKTCFRPTMVNFGSRDQFCIKSQFSAIKGRDLMESCSKAVKLFLRKKRKLQLDQQINPNIAKNSAQADKKQESHTCYLYKTEGQYSHILTQKYQNKIVTSDMIKMQGQLHGFCPYYYPFQVKDKADLIFMPYNYLLDVQRVPRYESIIKNSIIIFDEAHNVPESACDGRSFSIYSRIFDNIQVELKKLEASPYMSPQLKKVAYLYEKNRLLLSKQCQHFKKQLELFSDQIYGLLTESSKKYSNSFDDQFDLQQIFKPQDLRYYVYSWFGIGKLTRKDFESLSIADLKQTHMITVMRLNKFTEQSNQLIQALKQTYDGIFQNLQKITTFLSKCRDLIADFEGESKKQWWNKQINHYRLTIKFNLKDNILSFELKLVCLTPTLTFNDITKLKPRSIILTSGTLSPINSWEKQLKIKFDTSFVNKHVIDQSQLHLGVLCKSYNNESTFNFSYNELQKGNKIYLDLIKTIIFLSKNIQNGVLVIFPSYKVIKTFRDELTKNKNLIKQLGDSKNICFEDKGTIDYTLLNFKNKAKTKKGAILFCVCRGKISEGLDFSDELCRAVFFIGVPYPNIKDPILKEKRDYYDKLYKDSKGSKKQSLSGDQWYMLNTMRAVNQGIGRVIRHKNDYGMILMLDNRYCQSQLKQLFPQWTKNSTKTYELFDELEQKVNSFYYQMKLKYQNYRKQCHGENRLQFQDDIEKEKVKKISRKSTKKQPNKVNFQQYMLQVQKRTSNNGNSNSNSSIGKGKHGKSSKQMSIKDYF